MRRTGGPASRVDPDSHSQRRVPGTTWIPIDQTIYDSCRDPRAYCPWDRWAASEDGSHATNIHVSAKHGIPLIANGAARMLEERGDMSIQFGPTGQIAKVTAVSEDGCRIFFELRNGSSGWFEQQEEVYDVGDVLLLVDDNGRQRVEILPITAWPDQLWVGVVRIKSEDCTVITVGSQHRRVPTTDVKYEVGNTVEAGDIQGVVRVLSKTPISLIDLPSLDESVTDEFLWKPPDGTELGFDDFGGLKEVVDRARKLIEGPLQNREALSEIGARSIKGVLFTGKPGTGKTLLAQIIAHQSGAEFYRISGPEIFSKWVGQSEELLRKLFAKAADSDKAIIFFDEIDSVAAQRDDASQESSTRVVAQLLTLMDGFSSKSNVVVIAATNRPQDLDVALRRPGRFDWEIHFPYPNQADREDILIKTAHRLQTQDPLPHRDIAAKSEGWSAAELAAILTEAALLAVEDGRREIQEEDYIGGYQRRSRYRELPPEIRDNGGGG